MAVSARTQCNSAAEQPFRQNATSHQAFHCRNSTPHFTASGTAEARKNLPAPLGKVASGFSPITFLGDNLRTSQLLSCSYLLGDARRNSPSTQRGAQEICAFLLNYSALLATRPSVHFHPTRCLVLHRPRTTATLLISDFFLWCFFVCAIFVDMKTLIRVLKVRRGLNENGWVIPCFLLC